ncbi:type III secretion system translocon subunit SctE [Providencia burhodogranariea]|uniref:Uncharacterized protein n=1 Tax=Providencia burhodogranariea DSM 19968 TaxID=1141662 RepID=K8X4K5_9GAMM|nr:type III secretion system translocon subunit SctE [Providencia burhodogranariea]EKT64607.1 hypothetical protein OOA_02382 [Providencia burhodogranariea DSM 19968]
MSSISAFTSVDNSFITQGQDDTPIHLINEIEKAKETPSPIQPLPGSVISESELWRMVSQAFKTIADAVSGTAKESSAAKKELINTLKDSQIAQLNERMDQLQQQADAEKNKGFWGKIGMALGFLAAIVVAPFNPVMAAVMVGTMIAAIIVPKMMDKVLQAFGVDEKIRKWVSLALEVVIGVVGAVLTFNPGKIMTSVGKVAASTAAKVANTANKAVDALKSIRAFSAISQKAQNIVNKTLKLMEPLTTKIQELVKGGQLASARMGQVTSVASDVTSVVSTGYSIKSSAITRDLEVSQAAQEELVTRFEQLKMLLDTAMKALSTAFESLFDTKNSERQFLNTLYNIHM